MSVRLCLFDYCDNFDDYTYSPAIKERKISHIALFEITFHNEWDLRPPTE
jgi:hypothetical protein